MSLKWGLPQNDLKIDDDDEDVFTAWKNKPNYFIILFIICFFLLRIEKQNKNNIDAKQAQASEIFSIE